MSVRFLPVAGLANIGILRQTGHKPVAARFMTPAEAKARLGPHRTQLVSRDAEAA